MHGSLLPKYRGRVPVNWAVLHGETETGATLHAMDAKPDAGYIVDQTSVPILPDDTAGEVFEKVTVAAEQTLWRALPAMMAGKTPQLPNVLAEGSYFSGRRPEDGRIDWSRPAAEVYNLIRAVAPPYPGAFTELAGQRFVVAQARLPLSAPTLPTGWRPGLHVSQGQIVGLCGDGGQVRIDTLLDAASTPVTPASLATILTEPSNEENR
jgi:methionyl-tRNA formyltransferase